jgi:NADH-quinone oxidoreductase subunit K
MSEAALLQNSLLVGAALFCIGLVGFLSRRNMIVMFLCAEMMLQGVSVSFVAWGRWHNNWDGQVLVILILTVAACEAALALALFLMMFQRRGELDIAAWDELRESNLPRYADHELPEVAEHAPEWPQLTPAGAEPNVDVEEVTHRSHV